jgi:glucose/mannose-6-phosphate isomerase
MLDDPSRLRAHDPAGMLEAVESTPSMWESSFASAGAAVLSSWSPSAVAVCGMGGSGVSGDVLAAIAAARGTVPVVSVKGFDLPRWADRQTLVVCVSYSGDTEEAVACFDEARRRGAQLAAIAGGGTLAARASEGGVPCLTPSPQGLMPRAAFASLAACVLAVGERAGLVSGLDEDIASAVRACKDGLGRWGASVSLAENEAKRLALLLAGGSPRIWGQEGVLAVAAFRWKTQLNENAKIHASAAFLPEALHNEIVPLAAGEPLVILRADAESRRMAARIEALAPYEPAFARAVGTSNLAILASAILLGDLVSVYCAALRGVDPTPIEAITRHKRALGDATSS